MFISHLTSSDNVEELDLPLIHLNNDEDFVLCPAGSDIDDETNVPLASLDNEKSSDKHN
jgi:hypothetical protein